MPSSYPTSVDNLANPTASDPKNSATVPHASQHANANDAVEALENLLGVTGAHKFLQLNAATQAATSLAISGLTGAANASRYVGATAGGKPTSGTFAVGDYIIDRAGYIWICTVAGTPGTWVSPARGFLGWAEKTTSHLGIGGTEVDVTDLSVAVTVGTNRRLKVTAVMPAVKVASVSDAHVWLILNEAGTNIMQVTNTYQPGYYHGGHLEAVRTPLAGSITYKVRASTNGSMNVEANTTSARNFILVEDIGGT